MMKFKITNSQLFALIFIAPILFLIIAWKVSTKQIYNLCTNASKVMAPMVVIKAVIDNKKLLGYSEFKMDNQDVLTIRSLFNYGRFTCSLYYENDKVIKADFIQLD